MITVITSADNNVNADFDKRFGRAPWFCIFNELTNEVKFHENKFNTIDNSVGTLVSEKMIEMKVDKIISGDFGSKAKNKLNNANIQMVILQTNIKTIEEIINKIKQK